MFYWLETHHRSHSHSRRGKRGLHNGVNTRRQDKGVHLRACLPQRVTPDSFVLFYFLKQKVQKAVKCKVKFSFSPLILTVSLVSFWLVVASVS